MFITDNLRDIRRLLNVVQTKAKNDIIFDFYINQYLFIFNILKKYIPYIAPSSITINKYRFYDLDYNLDNKKLRCKYLKELVEYYINNLPMLFNKEDSDLIKYHLNFFPKVSDSNFMSNNITLIYKQTILFEESPVYSAIKKLLYNSTDSKTTQLEIEKLLNIAWVKVLNKNIKNLKEGEKNIINESFKILHEYVIEFEETLKYIQNQYKNKKYKKYEKAFKSLYDLDLTTITVIVFNNVISILSSIIGVPRNELLMKIGSSLFHRWALKLYEDKYIIEKNKKKKIYAEDRPSFKDFKKNLNIYPTDVGVLRNLYNSAGVNTKFLHSKF